MVQGKQSKAIFLVMQKMIQMEQRETSLGIPLPTVASTFRRRMLMASMMATGQHFAPRVQVSYQEIHIQPAEQICTGTMLCNCDHSFWRSSGGDVTENSDDDFVVDNDEAESLLSRFHFLEILSDCMTLCPLFIFAYISPKR